MQAGTSTNSADHGIDFIKNTLLLTGSISAISTAVLTLGACLLFSSIIPFLASLVIFGATPLAFLATINTATAITITVCATTLSTLAPFVFAYGMVSLFQSTVNNLDKDTNNTVSNHQANSPVFPQTQCSPSSFVSHNSINNSSPFSDFPSSSNRFFNSSSSINNSSHLSDFPSSSDTFFKGPGR